MYIAKFQVENYKSFRSSEEFDLMPGFNIVVGQNNAGKTALAEALSLRFDNKPHRSMKTFPRRGMQASSPSIVNIAFQLDEAEAEQVLIDAAVNPFFVPIKQVAGAVDETRRFVALLREPNTLQSVYQSGDFTSAYLEAYREQADARNTVQFTVDHAQQQFINEAPTSTIDGRPLYGSVLANALRNRIYLFKAERLNISMSPFGMQTVLASDASNLAEVLNHLQGSNPTRFDRFNEYVSTIFPEIKRITVPPGPANNQVQILVWSIDPDTERDDLAIPLSESGTGIGHYIGWFVFVKPLNPSFSRDDFSPQLPSCICRYCELAASSS